jgi:hypothetical protein
MRENQGHLVHTAGDSLLLRFDSIEGAVQFAATMQSGLSVRNHDAAPDDRLRFRIGIDISDVVGVGTDLHGEGLNVAVRLEELCPPGAVCVSRAIRDHFRERPGLKFVRLGVVRLKNIDRPVEAFILRIVGAPGVVSSRLVKRRVGAHVIARSGRQYAAAVGLGFSALLHASLAAWPLSWVDPPACLTGRCATRASPLPAIVPPPVFASRAAPFLASSGTADDPSVLLTRFQSTPSRDATGFSCHGGWTGEPWHVSTLSMRCTFDDGGPAGMGMTLSVR